MSRLQEMHDALQRTESRDQEKTRLQIMGVLKPLDKFNVIKSNDRYMVEFIKTSERLIEESENQNNCVWSYYKKVNDGDCGIFSIIDNKENKTYTCELRDSKELKNLPKSQAPKTKFFINQLLGKYNSIADSGVHDFINNQLSSNAK